MTVKEPKISITLTKAELWELMSNFDLAFTPGPGNELATKVSDKLHSAYNKVRTK
jgi:hypothetical protein